MARIRAWFSGLSSGAKVVVVLVVIALFVWASPVFVFLAVLALLAGLLSFLIRVLRRRPVRGPLIFCVGSFVAILVATGVSNALYGPAEAPEQAQRSPVPSESEAAEKTKPEEPKPEKTKSEPEPEPKPRKSEPEERTKTREPKKPVSEPIQADKPEREPRPEPRNTLASLGKVVTITRAVDGDTIEVSPAVNGVEDVRLIGVDTPEFSSDCGTQPLAQAAADYVSTLEGQKVALGFDEERIDPYDRVLAYVRFQGGGMLNEALVEQGYAQVATYPPNVRYESRFLEAQAEAQRARLGIWALGAEARQLLADQGNGVGGGCVETSATPTPTATPSATASASPEPEPEREPERRAPAPRVPPGGDVDCSDFSDEAEATPYLLPGDPYDLDGDDDGRACEPY